MIIKNSSLECSMTGIINALGGFHTILIFLGSIGHIMENFLSVGRAVDFPAVCFCAVGCLKSSSSDDDTVKGKHI